MRLGISYQTNDYVRSDGTDSRPSVDYLDWDLGYQTPFWSDRASAMFFLRYSQNDSLDLIRDWSSVQTGVSVSVRF